MSAYLELGPMQAGPKELWKLELAVDKAEQKLEAARLNLAQVPEMVRYEWPSSKC
jgi:hypothetical protein